jgi:hypothetical protein
MSLKSNNSKDVIVAIIAISIPIDEIALPALAVFGELNFFIPKINKIDARTYARLVYSIALFPLKHF